jgi:enterochelin esterase-like enzyme
MNGYIYSKSVNHSVANTTLMKFLLMLIASLLAGNILFAQAIAKGKVVTEKFVAPSIQNNPGGEDANRRITVYLPPGYETSKQRYPVIYFLHGFTINDSFYMATFELEKLFNKAIANGLIRPVIIVLPNSYTLFEGSFYTNSTLTGNWADYIAKDVVTYIDKKFRTIPGRDTRGLCGHSMGGNGAIKIGMMYSDVFSTVYALSPARLDWGEGLTANSESFKHAQAAKNIDELTKDFFALEATNLARTYSPNPQRPPFFVDFPYEYRGDSVVENKAAIEKWNANFPINMIGQHIEALKSLHALKLDWGRNEQYPFIPVACMAFSKKLESLGINHYAEEYIGNHQNKIGGEDGRIFSELLPFFNSYLKFKK